jgi:hypothetical protein
MDGQKEWTREEKDWAEMWSQLIRKAGSEAMQPGARREFLKMLADYDSRRTAQGLKPVREQLALMVLPEHRKTLQWMIREMDEGEVYQLPKAE